jgi:hypothetical protein
VLSGRGLCDELITRPEESYRLCCVVVCDLETPRIGAPYIYDISSLKVKVSYLLEGERRTLVDQYRNFFHHLGFKVCWCQTITLAPYGTL